MNFVLGFSVAILEFVARSRCKFLPGELWSHPNKIFVVFFALFSFNYDLLSVNCNNQSADRVAK